MSKDIKSLPNFENELFSDADLEFVDEKINANMNFYINNSNYMKYSNQQNDLLLKLYSSLDSNQLEILNDYISSSSKQHSYEACLAYYLGIHSAKNFDNLV